jgi:hypothetical protein
LSDLEKRKVIVKASLDRYMFVDNIRSGFQRRESRERKQISLEI